ncbi:glycosyltransferase [Dictyoglomus sp.]|uniref:glycosyltransferase n=1 Tax=Dictyoglomus sp. TaxID=28205 RepID=UPI003CC3EB7A
MLCNKRYICLVKSIIISTHNRERLLPRATESVRKQTYENWEILIVDDGKRIRKVF